MTMNLVIWVESDESSYIIVYFEEDFVSKIVALQVFIFLETITVKLKLYASFAIFRFFLNLCDLKKIRTKLSARPFIIFQLWGGGALHRIKIEYVYMIFLILGPNYNGLVVRI